MSVEHSGKKINERWVNGFLKHNSSLALEIIEEKRLTGILEAAEKEKVKTKHQELKQKLRETAIKNPESQIKDEIYEPIKAKGFCSACNGTGGFNGGCRKWGGTGWA